ncbi:hypothetical protein Teth39_0938 [Thermoanaerobacter pseudethanolicus ATCC 33223]|jgi:hypothetical protein|uniref:Uncharacterized protein n=2 Tax=Thermoanaerobacter TaxID=1754 RepID=B0K8Y0_THEP3|nr:hypothetical protein Teth39_0938 [Thermoanaerobacter pseudethanolicus ATCC 33223]
MVMNKKITSLFVILLIVTFTTSAYAAITTIVYQSGPNLVKSTEYYQYKYVGYIQLTSAYNDNGWSRLRGYIRYYIPNTDKDTGRCYTDWSLNGELVSREITFYDTLNPFAEKVRFEYGFDSVPYGSGILPFTISTPMVEVFEIKIGK